MDWIFEPIFEWSQLWQRCNWYTFTPIKLEVEDDRHMGSVEATAILLGIGFRVRLNWRETETTREIARQVSKLSK